MPLSMSPARRFVLRGLGALVLGAAGRPAEAIPERTAGTGILELMNTHTGELLQVAHNAALAVEARSLPKLQYLLRDHRNGQEHAIDCGLYAQLLALAADARVEARYEIISGYRSPATNELLHSKSSGVATRSLHLQGRALDVRLKGVDCLRLAELARIRQAGGVGYYRRSAFVHIDTGDIRTWNG